MPSLSSFCAVENPFMPYNDQAHTGKVSNAVMSLVPAEASVFNRGTPANVCTHANTHAHTCANIISRLLNNERGNTLWHSSFAYAISTHTKHTFSTINAVMPFGPAAASVFAYTISTSASGPFVIQNLFPFSTHLLPFFGRSAAFRASKLNQNIMMYVSEKFRA